MPPVRVRDLLAEPSLSLRRRAGSAEGDERGIDWVSTTELPDPLPFLRGGELVMTTGMLARSEAGWADLATRLAALPVAALCFGTGLVHQAVPAALVAAARDTGLTLVESPVQVPFVQISRWVADRIFAEQYQEVRAAARIQDALVEELLAGGGLGGLLRRLHGELDAGAVVVVEPDGRLLARHPARSSWAGGGRASGAGAPTETAGDVVGETVGEAVGETVDLPVRVDGVTVARLRSERPTRHPGLASFAVNILGLELARQQAVRTGRRELLGQVLEDLVVRSQSEAEARRRLAANGIRADEGHRVVVAHLSASAERLRRALWTLDQPFGSELDPHPTALVQGRPVVLLPAAVDPEAVCSDLHRRLRTLDPQVGLGVSQARAGVAGLRVGFFEAGHAAGAGPGVHRAAPLSAMGLLLGHLDLPMQDVGQALLEPLLTHDARHGADLVRTLRSYLAHDGQAAATASDLVLHRNTLRYRLQQIERLTGRDLGRLTDRIELWFALATLGWDPGAPDPL